MKSVHTLPCTWTETRIPHERFTENIRTLTLSGKTEFPGDALLVLACRDGAEGSPWSIIKAEPFQPRWDARNNQGDVRIVEWLDLEDTGRMTYHIRFLGEYLHGEATGQSLYPKEGPIITVSENFAESFQKKFPGQTGRFRKVSGLTIENKHPDGPTEIFCGLVQ